jgi:hypothetical protein
MHTGSYAFPCPSKAKFIYTYKVNVNLNVVSRPKFYILSNGTLGFPVSSVSVLYAENTG